MKYLVISNLDEWHDTCRGEGWYADHRIESFENGEDVIFHCASLNADNRDSHLQPQWDHWIFDKNDFNDLKGEGECYDISSADRYRTDNFDFSEAIAELVEKIKAENKVRAEAKKELEQKASDERERKRGLEQLAWLKEKYEVE